MRVPLGDGLETIYQDTPIAVMTSVIFTASSGTETIVRRVAAVSIITAVIFVRSEIDLFFSQLRRVGPAQRLLIMARWNLAELRA